MHMLSLFAAHLLTWYRGAVNTPFFRRINAHTWATVRRKTGRTSNDPAARRYHEEFLPGLRAINASITTPAISRWCIDCSIIRWYRYEKSHERRRRDAARRKSLDQRGDAAGRKTSPSVHHNCVLWIRSECARCTGFVVSWISVYSGEHNVHKEDRNALGYTSLHSCTRWRAILVTAVTEYEAIARCVSPEHETILFGSASPKKRSPHYPCKARKEPARLAKSFQTCWTLLSMPRTRDFYAAEGVRCKIAEAWCT